MFTGAAGVRHAVRRSLAGHPSLYLPIARRRYPDAVLAGDTHLLIDGFTRSAVTFAVVAFQVAQNDHVRVAHHLHAPAHVIAATRRGVPALVPVREPEETVLSALIREPHIEPGQFLRSYADFYERILPFRSGFFVAAFRDVTEDLGRVTRRLNERFGTDFAEFEHTGGRVEEVFELIEERSRRPSWERVLGRFLSGRMSLDEYRNATERPRSSDGAMPEIPEHRVQRPSEERQIRKDELRERYRAEDLAPLRRRAELAYSAVVAPPPLDPARRPT
jgi:hypothetical protein